LFRFLIWCLLIYIVARFLSRVINAFLEGSRQPRNPPERPVASPQKPPVEYKDVSDAKFIDVPNSSNDQKKGEESP
jgi:hypothetical protein